MLVVDRVSRSFGNLTAVRDVSFTVETGRVLGFLGPNGAGKTTTMRMLLGIYAPDSGSITWHGKRIDLAMRRRFGYLPEERGLYGKMRVRDHIAYFGRLHGLGGRTARANADTWIETLSLGAYAGRACGELSKGNQQKVQLACAVVHDPELLVLDEPFSGLDPLNAETMLDCIRLLRACGTTLVLSSHQMFALESACDTFCIVARGEVCTRGSLAELRAAFPTRFVRVAPDLPEIRAVFTARGTDEPLRAADGTLRYTVPASTDFRRLLRDAVAAGPLETLEHQRPSLSQIFVRATGSAPELEG